MQNEEDVFYWQWQEEQDNSKNEAETDNKLYDESQANCYILRKRKKIMTSATFTAEINYSINLMKIILSINFIHMALRNVMTKMLVRGAQLA